MNEQDDILAAEVALGLLEGAEGDAANRRVAADAGLAARAEWWRDRFEALAGEDRVEPGAGLWSRIEARLPRNDNGAAQVRRWRAAAFAATLVAVVLGASLALRPNPAALAPQAATATAPLLLASLTGENGLVAAVAYDPATTRLTLVHGAIDTHQHDPELWIIPAGGTARSLGTFDPAHSTSTPARADARRHIGAGATFAITLEQRGGSPTGQAQGPIIASGKIAGA